MSGNGSGPRPFAWTAQREETALLVAQDQLSDAEIAKTAGISERQLARWKRHPDFASRVDELVAVARAAVTGRGIAEMQNRIDWLQAEYDALRTVIAERGAHGATRTDVPGAHTGLLVSQVKMVKVYEAGSVFDRDGNPKPLDPAGEDGEVLYSGKRSVAVEEWSVDTATLREIRETLKQAAQELGQWSEKQEHSGPGGTPIPVAAVPIDYREAVKPLLDASARPDS